MLFRSATAVGARLLAYPHFIGTIHGFVDRFLALPALRSLGLTVDVIDDDIFAKKAIARAMKMPALWGWAQNDEGVKPLVGGLVYTDTWLWHKSGQWQLDTLTEGQD